MSGDTSTLVKVYRRQSMLINAIGRLQIYDVGTFWSRVCPIWVRMPHIVGGCALPELQATLRTCWWQDSEWWEFSFGEVGFIRKG